MSRNAQILCWAAMAMAALVTVLIVAVSSPQQQAAVPVVAKQSAANAPAPATKDPYRGLAPAEAQFRLLEPLQASIRTTREGLQNSFRQGFEPQLGQLQQMLTAGSGQGVFVKVYEQYGAVLCRTITHPEGIGCVVARLNRVDAPQQIIKNGPFTQSLLQRTFAQAARSLPSQKLLQDN